VTVSTIGSVAEFKTNGVTINYPFYFKFLANEDLVVTYVDPLGVSSVLTLGTQYTVSGAGNDEGGSVTTTVALAGPGQLAVSREMDAFQQTSLRNQGKFLAETHEDVFDRLTMLIQQGLTKFGRALTRPFGRDYFYAENRRITNVKDPVDLQDAATKLSVEAFVASVLATGQGPVNNAANVIYARPDGQVKTVQGMSGADGAKFIGYGSSNVGDELARIEVSQQAQDAKLVNLKATQDNQAVQIDALNEQIGKAGIYPGQRFVSYNGGGQIGKLNRMLIDPFTQSLGICIAGDSISWGMTTTGMGALDPRAGALTDARNNGSAPSWANLLHKWMGSEFYGGAPVVEAIWPGTPSGVAQFTYTKPIDVFPGFTPFTNIGSMSQLLASGSTLGVLWFVNMSISGGGPHSFSWVMTGDSFDIRFGATPEGAAYRLYIGGSLIGTYATSSADLGVPVSFQNTRTHAFTFQRNVTIKIEAVGGNAARDTLRVESIRFNRKLRVTNQGIVGVASERYRTVLLSSAMRADDSVCMIQLGTNDRGMPAALDNPTSPSSLNRNLGLMLDTVVAAGVIPIMFCANETDDAVGKFYTMGQVRSVISNLSAGRAIDFIDQYALTKRLKAANVTYLADGLHPNDLGHYLMFDNIRNVISSPSV